MCVDAHLATGYNCVLCAYHGCGQSDSAAAPEGTADLTAVVGKGDTAAGGR